MKTYHYYHPLFWDSVLPYPSRSDETQSNLDLLFFLGTLLDAPLSPRPERKYWISTIFSVTSP